MVQIIQMQERIQHKDAMWKLHKKYLFLGQYGELYLTYFGVVEVSGVNL